MMFENLSNIEINIFFDEWPRNKWFKLTIHNFLNVTEQIIKKQRHYYKFISSLYEDNPFRIRKDVLVKLHISKGSFEKEIIRHIDFSKLNGDKIDLTMDICRADKFNLIIKNIRLDKY